MAVTLTSIASANVPMLSKADFLAAAQHGDYLGCSGKAPISDAIEVCSDSWCSHVARIWDGGIGEALTFESTEDKGVHVGTLRSYVDNYDGDLILARRLCMTREQTNRALKEGIKYLGDPYDTAGLFKTAVDLALHKAAILDYKRQYCSELVYLMDLATDFPLKFWETPGQLFSDSTFVWTCAKLKGAQ